MPAALQGGFIQGVLGGTIYAIPVGPYRILANGAITYSATVDGVYTTLSGATAEPGTLVSGGFIQAAANRLVILKKINLISNSYPAVVARDNPILFYRFGEQSGSVLYDSIGATTAGQLTKGSGVTLGVAGPLADGSLAITGDGTVNGIASSSSGINSWSGQSALTLEIWGNNPAFGAHEIMLALGGQGIYISVNGGVFFGSIHVGGSQQTYTGVGAISANVWHHFAMTWTSGEKAKLYVDGFEISSGPSTTKTGTLASSPNVFVGCLGPNILPWSGSLANAAIYLRALTAAQINKHYVARNSL